MDLSIVHCRTGFALHCLFHQTFCLLAHCLFRHFALSCFLQIGHKAGRRPRQRSCCYRATPSRKVAYLSLMVNASRPIKKPGRVVRRTAFTDSSRGSQGVHRKPRRANARSLHRGASRAGGAGPILTRSMLIRPTGAWTGERCASIRGGLLTMLKRAWCSRKFRKSTHRDQAGQDAYCEQMRKVRCA